MPMPFCRPDVVASTVSLTSTWTDDGGEGHSLLTSIEGANSRRGAFFRSQDFNIKRNLVAFMSILRSDRKAVDVIHRWSTVSIEASKMQARWQCFDDCFLTDEGMRARARV